MDSPASESSGNSSTTSSSADAASADSLPAQDNKNNNMDSTEAIEHDDSASDISMPVETDDEDDETSAGTPTRSISEKSVSTPCASLSTSKMEGPKKRKYSISSDSPNGQLKSEAIQEDRKRHRPNGNNTRASIPLDKSLLPGEIWHHVFTFCPPRVLGRLLQVNKSFNIYLDPSASGSAVHPLPQSALKLLSPDTIWTTVRRHFPLPGMPAPLSGKSELQMWRIACGSLCQFCFKKADARSSVLTDKWHPGPGEHGVAHTFSLGLRSCGTCLEQRLAKEIDLLLSSTIPSPLMAALPFVFLTNELHVIPAATLQSGQQPPTVQIAKYFYQPYIERIKQEFEDVKALGQPTAEEWLKGLEGRGNEHRSDAGRWERWEASGGLIKMRHTESLEDAKQNIGSTNTNYNLPPPVNNSRPITYNSLSSLSQPLHLLTSIASQLPQPVHSTFAKNSPNQFNPLAQNGYTPFPSRPNLQPKHERTKEEVTELKAARRAEIERRCLSLDPPLTAGVLAHMASFQAAIQIIQPLTDSAWEVLKPRLLSQRGEAEQRESDRVAQTRVVQERFDERRYQDLQTKGDPKDLVDKEWDDVQAPLRLRIGGYADEIIRDGWNGGEKVSPDSCSRFAAEVLIYVRKRFYAELAKDEAAVRATGREPEMDPTNGPYTRRLTLENMKWVFDTKVKPHTENYRKEIFLCNACDYASKYYGFEGVIQHYAAKHTSALSSGSVVVHWKSEWPEYPPFNPDPAATHVISYYPAAPSASTPYAGVVGQPLPQNYGYGGYQPVPLPAPIHTPNPHSYQESPGPYYGHPQFGDQYSGHQNGPYQPPPHSYPDTSQGYHAPQYSMAPSTSTNPGYNDTSHSYNQQGYDGHYPPQIQGIYTSPPVTSGYPVAIGDVSMQQTGYTQPAAPYCQAASFTPPSNFPQAPLRSGEYTTQLQDLARNAREVWNSIGGLKEVPGSVKVYTIIYHILARFRATFQDDPPLSMVIDGLSNNKDMRPVRNVNGLLCKACSLGMAGSSSASQKKHFSFPQLVNHFHSLHEQGQTSLGHRPDWKTDMVLLPDLSKLTSIVSAPGIDDKKLKLLTKALPEIAPIPEPTTVAFHGGTTHHYGGCGDENGYPQPVPSQDNHEKYYTTNENGRGKLSEIDGVSYDPGEYDPRHPADPPLPPQSRHRPSRQFQPQLDARVEDEPHRPICSGDQAYRENYQDLPSRSYHDQPPPRAIPGDGHGLARLSERRRAYVDEPIRYRDASEAIEYRARREPRPNFSNSRPQIAQSYEDSTENGGPQTRNLHLRQTNDNAVQQSRIYEVVAQISQHAEKVRERLPGKYEGGEVGSEDGEVRVESGATIASGRQPPSEEATSAAERFLDEFRPGEVENILPQSPLETSDRLRRAWEADCPEIRQVYQQRCDSRQHTRNIYEDDKHAFVDSVRRIEAISNTQEGYAGLDDVPPSRQARGYAYDDRYVASTEERQIQRDRSPELVDRRYKGNSVVYRDERQSNNSIRQTPSRYARYESVRLENDRPSSRSPPVYVKIGSQSVQYREESPLAYPLRQESVYRTHTPQQHVDEAMFERPRREYVRVYADEHRPQEPQYAEAFEYVRVSDSQGNYVLRRPVRREVEPAYAPYGNEGYSRQSIYETRPSIARAEPAFMEEEEYDPRHPAAPPVPVRYQ